MWRISYMIETYVIDTEDAYNEFVEYLEDEKPNKTFKGDIIEFKDFTVRLLPEYKTRVQKLLESEYEASEGFSIEGYDIGIVENQGYEFKVFK